MLTFTAHHDSLPPTNKRSPKRGAVDAYSIAIGSTTEKLIELHAAAITHVSLPPNKKRKTDIDVQSSNPKDFVRKVFLSQGFSVNQVTSNAQSKYRFPKPEAVKAYTMEITAAARENDVKKLRELHASGVLLDCCNRFGDSLVHIASRRGNTKALRFLVEEAKVSVRFVDDIGRTPLHDACWTSEPNFEIVETLLREAPDHALCPDKRGHTPFDYARKGHWNQWLEFLASNETLLLIE
jgi:hypothetical protein